MKGKTILRMQKSEKFRLRRAKMNEILSKIIKISLFSVKIAPEGREIFWGRNSFHFTKTNKKNTGDHIFRLAYIPFWKISKIIDFRRAYIPFWGGLYSVFRNFKNNRKILTIYSGIYGHYPLYV